MWSATMKKQKQKQPEIGHTAVLIIKRSNLNSRILWKPVMSVVIRTRKTTIMFSLNIPCGINDMLEFCIKEAIVFATIAFFFIFLPLRRLNFFSIWRLGL